jgi:hypothetical protein
VVLLGVATGDGRVFLVPPLVSSVTEVGVVVCDLPVATECEAREDTALLRLTDDFCDDGVCPLLSNHDYKFSCYDKRSVHSSRSPVRLSWIHKMRLIAVRSCEYWFSIISFGNPSLSPR